MRESNNFRSWIRLLLPHSAIALFKDAQQPEFWNCRP
jgi:hypothetical protein